MLNLLAWMLLGLIAGWIADLIVPGEAPGGLIGTIIIGIVGAVLGGFIFQALGGPGITGPLSLTSILVAALGAIILLFIVRYFTKAT
ncbi:TPA: GlsB/YeaQ/YmgE family stress response membrane protein [candidate division CPR2 bacterium]|uniref:Transglycosylase-associated protein n=1 Tax=candidate division CPR2 bacterium GW2011_GWC1_41_48 TaxID=1618344 RepID=A0A0G0Z9V3_UNCC2|nr:MAG: Transglycosylase-associated protein [candidate division CPR2 bacterium GW2011_GWC2_39_35]KKR28119.1 MAG: Transglycosylase-associated protein [candidate division CPR2 bacterium GW2011_GWD2_39_7]KKR29556.1 MAG: Transglycosylase-associated protein [candidate division CPR2 bacterium GW2011_GWD1_39_7]KKS09823.1 MAG: hypothetical protein UU65_C0001G0228 [candidate division CPR2 bacterium GW2011_GWC1_41_48]OGB55862.1 MAG: hypothetical protein A2Y27_00370 [candidate division CPR2 bacterium GWD1